MLASACLTCTGQLLWKLASVYEIIFFVFVGFILYGCGAFLMILALRFGDLSVLHPMLGAGYVLSIGLGSVVLGETISLKKLVGITIILVGLVLLSRSGKERKA